MPAKSNAPPAPSTKEIEEWTPEQEKAYQSVLSIGEECISTTELKAKVAFSTKNQTPFRLYDGFEPSGRMHIAQGIFKAMNVNKATESGGVFVFWVADWFALMNDKMGGDLDKIKIVGKYLIEVWKAAGMKGLFENVIFLWASDEICSKADTYWPLMLDVGRRFNITRIKKCCQIMGRLEGNLTAAQILYPLMQCTDVFFLKADICQLGVDQRKVNMLAREYCDAAKKKFKPVILSHHMLMGLKAGQEKMSKSDPDSAVFMEDTADDVCRKIQGAYCPRNEGEIDKNPCLDYIHHIIFSPPNATFTAGNTTYNDHASVKKAFVDGDLSEDELKLGLTEELNKLLEPVRVHFQTDEHAKQLFEQVLQFKREASTGIKKMIRKLDLVGLQVIPANAHVLFLPYPQIKPTLEMLYDTYTHIQSSKVEGQPVVLFLPDWSARVLGSLDADTKAINAFYTIYLTALKALLGAAEYDKITVHTQSEGILKDPSNYWISVINVGRFFNLNEVQGATIEDADGVGNVIARLMRVADAMSLSPSLVTSSTSKSSEEEMSLIQRYMSSSDEIKLPILSKVSTPSLLLMQHENDAHKMDSDEYYILDDPKVHGKSKMKKAFCEPGNITFNPPITLLSTFSLSSTNIIIPRSDANGGEVTYVSQSQMEQDFMDNKLHPADLKNATTKVMVDILTNVFDSLKVDGDAKNACKVMKNVEKKMAKKGSK